MTDHQATLARLASEYGVQSSDPFVGDITEYHQRDREQVYDLADFFAQGGQLTRIRLLAERGYPYMDVSYVYGMLGGQEVRLQDGLLDPSHRLGRKTYRSQIAATIKDAGGTRAQQQQAWDSGNYAIMWG